MVPPSVEIASEHRETKDTLESEIPTNQKLSVIPDSTVPSEQTPIQVSEQLKIEEKLIVEEPQTTSENNQLDHLDVNEKITEEKYNSLFLVEEKGDRNPELDDKKGIKDPEKENNLVFSSDSSKNGSTIPVSELDRRLEYFAHIWFLHREDIEPAQMLKNDPDNILILYETNSERVQEDFVRLKTAIQLGEVPTWHKRKFAEYIVPREVMPTYIDPISGENIVPDQSIIQEVESLIKSFVKGLPE